MQNTGPPTALETNKMDPWMGHPEPRGPNVMRKLCGSYAEMMVLDQGGFLILVGGPPASPAMSHKLGGQVGNSKSRLPLLQPIVVGKEQWASTPQ